MEKIAGRRDHFGWLLGIIDTSGLLATAQLSRASNGASWVKLLPEKRQTIQQKQGF